MAHLEWYFDPLSPHPLKTKVVNLDPSGSAHDSYSTDIHSTDLLSLFIPFTEDS